MNAKTFRHNLRATSARNIDPPDPFASSDLDEVGQARIIDFAIGNPDVALPLTPHFNPDFFAAEHRPVIAFMRAYMATGSVPSAAQIELETGVKVAPHVCDGIERKWMADRLVRFLRLHAAAHIPVPDYLLTNDLAGLAAEFEAVQKIGVPRRGARNALDPSQWPSSEAASNLPTGFAEMDAALGGGLRIPSLTLMCGLSGMGKSMLLQYLAVQQARAGRNVMFLTLELDEEMVRERIVQMWTGESDPERARLALRCKPATDAGQLVVQYLPQSTTTALDIRAEFDRNLRDFGSFDLMCVDYLDVMAPNNPKINPSDLFVKDKYVAEELRGVAVDYKIPIVSASQLNRSAIAESDRDHSHIAGGISKINTADNVLMFRRETTGRWEEPVTYHFSVQKCRTGRQPGAKFTLLFDPRTARFSSVPPSPGSAHDPAAPPITFTSAWRSA